MRGLSSGTVRCMGVRFPVWAWCGVLLVSWLTAPAFAQTRAWLSRDAIALGETTTLNIETDQGGLAEPDYSRLEALFEVSDHTSGRRYELVNGNATQRTLYAVALRPRTAGALRIPALPVGGEHTQALTLQVEGRAPAPAAARNNAVAFIETELDANQPYVQQAVAYTVRLYYAVQVRQGELKPDPQQPDGATLQEVGDSLQYTRQAGGRTYQVLERHYLLIPERAGALTVPGMLFRGQTLIDPLGMLSGRDDRIGARSPPVQINVRPLPANAPQPWLPLRELRLTYLRTPQRVQAGQAASVVLEAQADGATAAQLPALQLGEVAGAQVFAEPAQIQERMVNGRPRVQVRRAFSIVPARPGQLRIHPPALHWWDTQAGQPRTAELPALTLQVQAGPAGPAITMPGQAPGAAPAASPAVSDGIGISTTYIWALLAGMLGLLVMLAVVWVMHRRGQQAKVEDASQADIASRQAQTVPALAVPPDGQQVRRSPSGHPPMRTKPPATPPGLAQALQGQDLAVIAQAWCAAAQPVAPDLDAVRTRLEDPRQIQALDALQQARWGQGDPAAALAQARTALRDGVRWRSTRGDDGGLLPPLYPERPPGAAH